MKLFFTYGLLFLFIIALHLPVHAQEPLRYNNSFRLQYGLYQYNGNQEVFLNDENKNFLSIGFTYRTQLGDISGLNITGRHYQWALADSNTLNTYAAQFLWVLHAKRIGSNWRLNRLTPYAGIGAGFEKHQLTNKSNKDSSFTNLYIPVEAGLLFNLSDRWSLGVFAEYKLATTANIKQLTKTPEGKMDIVNTAGVTLAWNFGSRQKRIGAPVIYTNPALFEKVSNVKTAAIKKQDTVIIVKKIIEKTYQPKDSLLPVKVKEKESERMLQDSIVKLKKDSIIIKLKTTEKIQTDSLNKTYVYIEKSLKDSSNIDAVKTEKRVIQTKPATAIIIKDSSSIDSVKIEKRVIQPKPVAAKALIDISNSDTVKAEQQVIQPKPVTVKADQKEMDSLKAALNALTDKINKEKPTTVSDTVIIRETLTIEPMATNLEEEPVITGLKQSYNKLGEIVEKNYSKGKLTDAEFVKIKTETDQIKSSISQLSNEDEVAFNELSIIYDAIAAIQTDMDRDRSSRIRPTTIYLNYYFDSLQQKVDRSLKEIDSLKTQVNNIKKDTLKTVPVQINTTGDSLRQKLKTAEEKNIILNEKLKKLVEPVQKDIAEKNTDNIVHTVKFSVNSSLVSTLEKAAIKAITDSMQLKDNQLILLSGYTDKSGNVAYNKLLSKKRSASVKAELLKAGINNEIILERNFGSDKAGEKINENDRKVVIRLLNR